MDPSILRTSRRGFFPRGGIKSKDQAAQSCRRDKYCPHQQRHLTKCGVGVRHDNAENNDRSPKQKRHATTNGNDFQGFFRDGRKNSGTQSPAPGEQRKCGNSSEAGHKLPNGCHRRLIIFVMQQQKHGIRQAGESPALIHALVIWKTLCK